MKTERARLAELTAMMLEQSLSVLESASRQRVSIEERIAALDAERHRAAAGWDSAARAAGAEIAWLRWSGERRAALNMELARARAAQDAARVAASAALGRDHALNEVLKRLGKRG